MNESKTGNRDSDVPPEMAPFDVWSEWMRANMGPMMATPGVSVPWLMRPGVRTGEELAGGHKPSLGPPDIAGGRRGPSRQAVLGARLGAEPVLRDPQGVIPARLGVSAR